MARNKKQKQRKRNTGYGNPRAKQNVAQGSAGTATRFLANTGTVWPPMPSLQNTVHLAMQFTFQVTERWQQDRLLASQLLQATELVRHAVTTVPYYRDKFRDQPWLSHSAMTWEDFQNLPLLGRTDIQNAGKALVSEAIPGSHGPHYEVRSSGSTGRPVQVLGTGLTDIYVRAFSMRGHLWHGRDLSAKCVNIRSAPTKTNPAGKYTWSAVLDGGEDVRLDINLPIGVLLDQLVREDPDYLQTHPYTLKGLIKNSLERNMRPKSLREARTFGEALDPDVRELARAHWGVEVIDNYSAMEVGMIAMQCPENENLHIQSESVLVEVLDDDGRPCLPGQVGRVVITALHNFATPLIRYAIGDYAEVGDTCACGRSLPVLKRILGRQRNFLVLPSGEKLFPEARITLTDIAPGIQQFQLTQKSLQEIEVKLVVASPLSSSTEAQMVESLVKKFGHPFDYQFVYVDDIPRGANGKFEEFISEVL